MKRRLAVLSLLLFIFTAIFPLAAEAATYRCNEIKNLKVSVNKENGTVTFKWDAYVVDRFEFNHGGTRIAIKRSAALTGKGGMDTIHEIPTPSSEGWHSMSWTDRSPPTGKVHYNIEAGSIAKRNKSVTVTVPKHLRVRATGYSHGCGTGDGKTSTGTTVREGVIAVDPDVIPYGSEVYIPELDRYFVAEDTGGFVNDQKSCPNGMCIDIFFNTEEEALQWGARNIDIYITGERELGEHNADAADRLEFEGEVDWSEKMASNLLLAIPNFIVKQIGLYDPIELVFMIDTDREGDPDIVVEGDIGNGGAGGGGVSSFRTSDMPSPADVKYLYTYSEKEMGHIASLYDNLSEFAPIWMVVMIVLVGLGLLWVSANPQSKVGFREYLVGVIAGVVILKFGPQLIAFVFEVNYAIVKQFQYICGHVLQDTFLGSLYNDNAGMGLGNALIAFVAVFGIGVINFQYIMRKIMIALLIGLIPIVAIIAISPARREVLGIWCKEFISNVFLQGAHAAALAFIVLLINASHTGPQVFWVKLAAILGLASMAGLVRRITGAETFGGPAGGIGAMFGVAALAGVGRMLMGGKRGSGPSGGVPGALGGGQSLLGRVAGGVGKVGLGVGGAMVGGLAAGAAMGNPAPGMMIGGSYGTSLGERAGDSIGSLTSTGAYQGNRPLDKAASDASIDVFGRNVMAERPGLRKLADTVTGKDSMIQDARSHFGDVQQGHQDARLNLTQARAQRDLAKAQYGDVKDRFARREKLQDSISNLTAKRTEAEQGMLTIAQRNNEHSSMEHWPQDDQQVFLNYQDTYDNVSQQLDSAHTQLDQIHVGEGEYEEAYSNMRSAEMDYAQKHMAFAQAEQSLSQQGLSGSFAEIKQDHTALRKERFPETIQPTINRQEISNQFKDIKKHKPNRTSGGIDEGGWR